MAVESRDTRLLPEAARLWLDALSQRFGACVESQLIEATGLLVDQYLEELEVAPKSDDDRRRYVARVAFNPARVGPTTPTRAGRLADASVDPTEAG
jgi:hypothetical protein